MGYVCCESVQYVCDQRLLLCCVCWQYAQGIEIYKLHGARQTGCIAVFYVVRLHFSLVTQEHRSKETAAPKRWYYLLSWHCGSVRRAEPVYIMCSQSDSSYQHHCTAERLYVATATNVRVWEEQSVEYPGWERDPCQQKTCQEGFAP